MKQYLLLLLALATCSFGQTKLVAGNGAGITDPTAFKTQLSLQNVNNTSDANKPVSTAVTAALVAKADGTDVFGAMNDDNWQPWTMTKVTGWQEGASDPVVWVRMGDSLSTGVYPGPRMSVRGYIGQAFTVTAGSINRTDGNTGAVDYTKWFHGTIDKPQVGSTGEFRYGMPSSFAVQGSKAIVIYRTKSGGGSFDVQFQKNGGSWVTDTTAVVTTPVNGVTSSATTLNTNAASDVQVAVYNLVVSNAPAYKMRITNVTTAEVEIIGGGIFYNSGPGIISVEDLFSRGGIDPTDCIPGKAGCIPTSEFNKVVAALNGGPDILMNCWADTASRWTVGNEFDQLLTAFQNATTVTVGSGATTNYDTVVTVASTSTLRTGMLVSGTGIQANTRITSINSGTSLTLSQRVTATNTGLTLTFKRDPDWVMISGTPAYDALAAAGGGVGLASWVTSTSYTVGQRVHSYDATPVGDLNDINDVFVCTSNHTSGSTTKPGTGASWNTVWQIDPYDPTVLAYTTPILEAASNAAKDWCTRNRHTFWNGTSIFRDYKSARERGLMRDFVHPSAQGDTLRWTRMYQQLSIGQLSLGATDRPLGTTFAGPGMWYIVSQGTPRSAAMETARTTIIKGDSLSSANLQIADQVNDAARQDAANNMVLSVDTGEGFIKQSTATIGVLGKSTQQGFHPASNSLMLGGRYGYRWRGFMSGLSLGYRSTSSSIALDTQDYAIEVTSGTPTITLPLPTAQVDGAGQLSDNTGAGVKGRIFVIRNNGAGTTTVSVPTTTRTSGVTNSTTTLTWGNNGSVPPIGSLVTSSSGDIPASTTLVTATAFGGTISQAATGGASGQTFTFTPTIDKVIGGTVAAGAATRYQSTGGNYITW